MRWSGYETSEVERRRLEQRNARLAAQGLVRDPGTAEARRSRLQASGFVVELFERAVAALEARTCARCGGVMLTDARATHAWQCPQG